MLAHYMKDQIMSEQLSKLEGEQMFTRLIKSCRPLYKRCIKDYLRLPLWSGRRKAWRSIVGGHLRQAKLLKKLSSLKRQPSRRLIAIAGIAAGGLFRELMAEDAARSRHPALNSPPSYRGQELL
jgi:hypothetical protein